MQKEVRETIKEANDSSVALLFTDLELAHTMFARAEHAHDPETRERNLKHVATACASIRHFMGKLQLTKEDKHTLTEKLQVLETRMAELRER